ncbi:MAG: hypothetical protein EPN30_00805 [Actinomycetota bacterium]|nr:MAG: hypothetical protein EPN30_00805 [Actinomycetota bacterium]
MRQLSRELLVGAFDLHTHGYPEIHRGLGMALDDFEQAEYAKSRGMAGYLLKSHIWPTMDRVYHIRQRVEGLRVVSCIVLNSVIGGIQPGVLEAAILQGAESVCFPTWSSANDLNNNGFSRTIRKELPSLEPFLKEGLTVMDAFGDLSQDARDVLRVAKEANILVSTGHLSGRESVLLAREADRIGFRKLVITHPDSNSVRASDEEIIESAKCGAFIEWTLHGTMPKSQRTKPQKIVEWIERLGAQSCVLTTDVFGRSSLPEPDELQLYLGVLLELGVSADDIKTMSHTNPISLVTGNGE